ncbi:acylphosphatase [Marinobacter mobilis]|uniref:acylphosphatase n=1 Tax=Marinobacter mobilis TaxID=488533 RepID=A0A1H3BJY8_9GAMM|nr:acylphosphatase [Marinobacter mobilis]SDX42236.1 acylphosphatase [Marinobacter mobilis]
MTATRWTMQVTGRVQGVYYRANTQKAGADLGLTGYALNLPDGGVEVVAEGDRKNLQALHDWCKKGPPAARVDRIVVTESQATGEFSDFSIRR